MIPSTTRKRERGRGGGSKEKGRGREREREKGEIETLKRFVVRKETELSKKFQQRKLET